MSLTAEQAAAWMVALADHKLNHEDIKRLHEDGDASL